MKCIHCDQDSKYSERPNKRCPGCGRSFAFEPKNGDKFTDKAFKAMIDRVSAGGTVRWGKEHLHYEVCRVALKGRRAASFAGYGFGAFVGLFGFAAFHTVVVPAILGVSIAMATRAVARSPLLPMQEREVEALLGRWQGAHGYPQGLITRPEEYVRPPAVSEEDMAHYSFDRAVICDRARTVDLLLANNFHFENNCAVLGVNGYPKATFELVRKMLRRNPKLQVFVLHDATPEGCNLARRLAADPTWFRGIGYVIDVGIRPHHAKAFSGAFMKAEHPIKDERGLLPGEAAWLRKYRLELAAVRPEQVIKRLFKAMSAQMQPVPGRPGVQVHTSEQVIVDDGPVVQDAGQGVDGAGSWAGGDTAGGSWGGGGTAGGSWGADMDSFGGDADASDGGGDSFG